MNARKYEIRNEPKPEALSDAWQVPPLSPVN
jgi:hypothetical protein